MTTYWKFLLFSLSFISLRVFPQDISGYRILNVTLDTYQPEQLQLNHGRLIWKDTDQNSGFHHLKYFSGAEIFVLDSTSEGFSSAIDNNYIAWNTDKEEIKYFNTRDWTTQTIGSSFNPDFNQPISLDNGKIAFARPAGNGSEIVVRDLMTGEETIFSEGVWNLEPSMDHGQLAWVQKSQTDTTRTDIYFYNGQTSRILTSTGSVKNSRPVLKDGLVIWIETQGNSSRVKLFDGDSVLTLVEAGAGEVISGYDLSNGIALASINDTVINDTEIRIYNSETGSFSLTNDTARISGLHIDNGLIVWSSGTGVIKRLILFNLNTGLMEEWGAAQYPVVDDEQIAWTLGDAVSLMIPVTSLQISSGIENGWPQSRFKANEGDKVIWGNIDNSADARLFYSNGNSTVQLTDSSVYKDFIMVNDGYAIWRHDFASLYLYDGVNPPELIFDSLQCENMYMADGSIGFHGFRIDAGNNVNQAWLYRINSDDLIQLTFDDSINVKNTFTIVDGDYASWYRDSSDISMLMLYDGSSTMRLSDSVINSEFSFREGKIVWSESRNGVFQIMMYNLQTRDKKQLTEGPDNRYRPETDGSVVVWFEDTPTGTIMWYYDIASNEAHKVVHYKPPVFRWLWLSKGKIAWSFDGEICVYDGNRISQLTSSAPFNPNHEPFVDDDVVIWNKNNPDPNGNHYGQLFRVKLHPHVDFDAENITGNAPLTVSFFNNSFQGVGSYQWNFGDGETSLEKNPVHIYQEPGVYSVTLTAGGLTGPALEKKINLVRVNQETPTGVPVSVIPGRSMQLQVYPNPINSIATISWELLNNEYITLKVYNLHGVELETLVNDLQSAGKHQFRYDAGKLTDGIYLVQLKAGNDSETIVLNRVE